MLPSACISTDSYCTIHCRSPQKHNTSHQLPYPQRVRCCLQDLCVNGLTAAYDESINVWFLTIKHIWKLYARRWLLIDLVRRARCIMIPWGTYVLDQLKNIMLVVTSVCAKGLAQLRACSEGAVSAEHCLQREAGELDGVTRARQARPLSACATL